jgi:hypothetical protein
MQVMWWGVSWEREERWERGLLLYPRLHLRPQRAPTRRARHMRAQAAATLLSLCMLQMLSTRVRAGTNLNLYTAGTNLNLYALSGSIS